MRRVARCQSYHEGGHLGPYFRFFFLNKTHRKNRQRLPPRKPRGRQIVTLEDAAVYIQKLSKAEQQLEEWQAAVEAPLLVVKSNGPTMMARIGGMRRGTRTS